MTTFRPMVSASTMYNTMTLLSSFAHSSFQLVEVILHNQEEEQLRRAQKHLNREINKYITFVSQHAQHSQHHQ